MAARRAADCGCRAFRCSSRRCSGWARTRRCSGRSSTRCCRSICARTSSSPATRSSRPGTFLAILLGTIVGGSVVLFAQRRARRRGLPASPVRSRDGSPRARFLPRRLRRRRRPRGHVFCTTRSTSCATSRAQPKLLLPVLAVSWFWLFGATVVSGLPVFAKDVLFADEQVVTLMLALFAIGVGVGSLLAERLLHGEVSARTCRSAGVSWPLCAVDLLCRPAPVVRAPPDLRRGGVSPRSRQLADPGRSGRPRDRRRPLHRAALRASCSTRVSPAIAHGSSPRTTSSMRSR